MARATARRPARGTRGLTRGSRATRDTTVDRVIRGSRATGAVAATVRPRTGAADPRVHRDDDQISRAKTGDPDAWRELYRAHAGRLVVWLSTRPSGDSAVAPEDLAGEAWLVAARRVSDFTGTSEQFAGWLFGIARNLAATTDRRSRRRRTDPGLSETLELPADDVIAEAEGRDWVRSALATLPPRERDVVACIDGVGLDVAGTAEALGISAVAVRVAHHRGLKRLRAAVTPEQPVTPAGLG
nr:sigma-70 family RNA polymerase sigma factor [Nocardioides sp. cx-173]